VSEASPAAPGVVLLCHDGSPDAAAAIARAGEVLSARDGVVLSVWEPVRLWEPWDPATIISAPLARLAAHELDLDEVIAGIAADKATEGAALARAAGFDVTTRVAEGKAWQVICEIADELDAEPIVIGSRGLGRASAALLGSVSAAVIAHTRRTVLVGHERA
jgi:nucleotide-binding universal stress UspA family protein